MYLQEQLKIKEQEIQALKRDEISNQESNIKSLSGSSLPIIDFSQVHQPVELVEEGEQNDIS